MVSFRLSIRQDNPCWYLVLLRYACIAQRYSSASRSQFWNSRFDQFLWAFAFAPASNACFCVALSIGSFNHPVVIMAYWPIDNRVKLTYNTSRVGVLQRKTRFTFWRNIWHRRKLLLTVKNITSTQIPLDVLIRSLESWCWSLFWPFSLAAVVEPT